MRIDQTHRPWVIATVALAIVSTGAYIAILRGDALLVHAAEARLGSRSASLAMG